MEENSQQPGAEEQKEPQNTNNLDLDKATPTDHKIKTVAFNDEKAVEKVQKTTLPEEQIQTNKENINKSVDKSSDKMYISEEETKSSKDEKEKSNKKIIEDLPPKEVDFSKLSINELIEAFKKITTGKQWLRSYSHIQSINRLYEEKFHADFEATKKVFIDNGGNEIDFLFKPEYKKQFDQFSYEYKNQRRNYFKEQEAAHKVNLEHKKAIIEEIKALVGADKNIDIIYRSFRTLQESWYSTGPVSRSENQNLWETYKHHVERFYDFLHLNRELRELDFKHNYEEKLKIIERAEVLKNLPDVIRASRDLNILHQLWKNDLGPVAKEHREVLWKRFQEATKIIQVRRQEYQKDITVAMKENFEKKKTLLKEMQKLAENEPQSHNAWQTTLEKFNKFRDDFKNIGYLQSKESKVTWQEFREIGRDFMQKKNIFYKKQKQEYNQSIDAKKGLIEKSKTILNSSEWDSMVLKMKDIQKKWKSIGFVPKKLENKLWSEFSKVHKTYFDRIKSGYQHLSSEQEVLQNEKLDAIEILKSTKFSEDSEKLIFELTKIWQNWNGISKIGGQTEFELNKNFSTTLYIAISKLNLDKIALKQVKFKLDSILLQNDPNKLQKKLNEVKSNLSKLKTEHTQLENNLDFFSHSSSENPLYKNVEKQIKSCQTKIDKAQEEYIHIKQIKNAQIKLANQRVEKLNDKEENQES